MPEAPKTDLPKPNATTDAEKQENRTAFIRNIVGIRKPKESTEKPAEKPGDKPAEAKPGEKPADKPIAAAKKKVTAPKAAPVALSTEDLATAVSTGVREALKPADKPKVEEPKPTDKLSDKDKKRYAVFEQMEKNNPTANTGLAKKFLENRTKHEEYQKAWEAKNPGKKFDIGEDEHADFIAANDLTWDEDEYVEALTDLKSSKALNNVEEKFKGQLTEQQRQREQEERAREEAPLVIRHQVDTARTLFKNLGDEFAKVLNEDGNINIEEVKRLSEENPIYKKTVFPMAQKVEAFAGELLRIARGHTSIRETEPTAAEWAKMNPAARAQHLLHAEIVNYVTQQEQIFDQLPDEKKMNQRDQMFTTSEKYSKMTKAQQAKHWVLRDSELSALYAMDASVAIKKSIEAEEGNFRQIAEKRGLKLPEAPKPGEKPAEKPVDDKAADVTGRRPPPSTVSPRMATKPGEQKDEKTATYKGLLGRR